MVMHSFFGIRVITGTRGSANIDSVPRAQGKIESNMAYPDMFVQLATTLGTELLLTADSAQLSSSSPL